MKAGSWGIEVCALVCLLAVAAACGGSGTEDSGPDASGSEDVCDGIDCGEHGECQEEELEAVCACDSGYVPDGLTCVAGDGVCDDVDCGEFGECDDAGGTAECLCDDGYRAEDLTCVRECEVWTSPETLEVPSVQLGGTVTVGGATPAQEQRLRFESPDGAHFSVEVSPEGLWRGTDPDDPFDAETVSVPPGDYEVYWERRGVGPALLDRGLLDTVELADDTNVELDVPIVAVDGSLDVGGEPAGENVRLRFVREGGGEVVFTTDDAGQLGHDFADDLALLEGSYRVYYSRGSADGQTHPRNEDALISTLEISEENSTISLEVPRVRLGGSLSADGEPSTGGASLLFEGERDDAFEVAIDADGNFAIGADDGSFPIMPGTYQISYQAGVSSLATHPRNELVPLREIELTGDDTVELDVPVARLSGTLAIDGESPARQVALLFFPEEEGVGFSTTVNTDGVLGSSSASADIPLVPGTYHVAFYALSVGEGIPPNREAVFTTLDIDSDKSVELDVPVVMLTGSFTVNGHPAEGPFPLRFEDEDDGFLQVQPRPDGSLAPDGHPILPGEYSVFYRAEFGRTSPWSQPPNRTTLLAEVDLRSEGSVELDLPVDAPRGEVTGGDADPDVPIELWFSELDGPDFFSLDQPPGEGLEEILVSPGTYLVRYQQPELSETVPMAENYELGCYEIEAPVCEPTCCVPAPERVLSQEEPCQYDLPGAPVLADQLEVWVDDDAIARDETDGWEYRDETQSSIEIHGPTCDAIASDDLEVKAAVEC